MNINQAREIVAQRVLCRFIDWAEDELADYWESFPDVGEYAWQDIVGRIQHIVAEQNPDDFIYKPAYELLASQAEKVT